MSQTGRHIIFYAPLGYNYPEQRLGGAESGCRRTLAFYKEAGLHVHCIEKPAISQGKVVYVLSMLLVPIILFFKIVKYPNTPVHIVGFYCKIAFHELFLVRIAKYMGRRVLYEMRNGNVESSYVNGTNLYKRILKCLCTESDIVFGQGQEVVRFIKNEFGVKCDCFPNFVDDVYVTEALPTRNDIIRLVFFGRIAKPKNIHLIIDVLASLDQLGYKVHLDLVGSYLEDYYNLLQERIDSYGLTEKVTFYGRKNLDFIVKLLKGSHYFIFPTENKGEGHSNSLTEAMACGVVPIVSNVGFNASVCGKDELVVKKIAVKEFVDKIIEIESLGTWESLSKYCVERVKKNYTKSVVGQMLLQAIDLLFVEKK